MFVLTLKYLISGNASQVSDGAGAVLLMKRRVALEKNLPILGVFRFVFSALFLRTRQTAGEHDGTFMALLHWQGCCYLHAWITYFGSFILADILLIVLIFAYIHFTHEFGFGRAGVLSLSVWTQL